MNNKIIQQLEIDVKEILSSYENEDLNENKKTIKARLDGQTISKESNIDKNNIAVLQVNIAEKNDVVSKISSAVDLIDKKFSALTIFIDMELTELTYRIIMPYISEKSLLEIVEREKADWIRNNIPAISQITIPWSIVTNGEARLQKEKNNYTSKIKKLIEEREDLRESIATDINLLKKYLSETHKIPDVLYKNDVNIESYIINRISTIKAIYDFNNHNSVHIAADAMCSYNCLYNTMEIGELPHFLTINFDKVENERNALTSTQLNEKLHELDLLGKISNRKSYLENSIKHFPGNVYIQSTNRTLLGCNKEHSLEFGIEEESYLEGKLFEELLPQDDADKVAEIVDEIISTNETKVLVESYVFLEKRCNHLTIKVPLRNKRNTTIGIIGFSIKIDDKEELERIQNIDPANIMESVVDNKSLSLDKKQAAANLKKTMENMPGYVFWQDVHGKILGCNNNQAIFLGYNSADELIGRYPNEFLIPKHAKIAHESLKEMAVNGAPIITEEIYKSGDNLLAVISHKTPIKDSSGNVIGVMVISIDISKSKQHEMQLEKEKEKLEVANSFKNQFIQDIEHDMRTPFVGLCSMTELCAHKESNPEKKEQLNEIASCAKDLLSYCDSLLEFSKNSSLSSNKNHVAIKDLTNSIINTSITSIRAKGLEFQFDYDENIPASLVGDSYRLKRILSNLMSNAIKYTNKGHVKLAIALESFDNDQVSISFSVVDTGVGISKEKQQEIFNKYKVIKGPKRKNIGQGLGLSEVKRFVEDLDGTITINSCSNKGSDIKVTLPFNKLAEQDNESFLPQQLKAHKILIVEDSVITIRFLESMMQEINCYSRTAASGKETLDILKNEPFDIILLDIGLEDTDGYSLAKEIRELEKQESRLPAEIIIMTAQKSRLNQDMIKELNILQQFVKPLKVKELINTIQAITETVTT